MKKYLYKILILICITQTSYANQEVEKEKKIIKTYQVSDAEILNIDNQYGQVHINTWDKNEILVEVRVTASHRSADRVESMLEKVVVSDHRIGNQIYFKTSVNGYGFSITTREMLRIDYRVFMPAKNALILKNKFGDASLSKLSGDVQLDVSYGDVRIDDLKGPNKFIKVSFGSLTIVSIDQGRMELSYSKLRIDKAGSIELSNMFGKTEISEVNTLKITQKYGNLELDKVSKLSGTIEFAQIEIDELGKNLDVNLRYCNNVDIGRLASNFEWIKIDASYSVINFKIHEQNVFRFDLNLKYGEFNNNSFLKPLELIQTKDQKGGKHSYSGRYGKSGDAYILLNVDYCGIYFR